MSVFICVYKCLDKYITCLFIINLLYLFFNFFMFFAYVCFCFLFFVFASIIDHLLDPFVWVVFICITTSPSRSCCSCWFCRGCLSFIHGIPICTSYIMLVSSYLFRHHYIDLLSALWTFGCIDLLVLGCYLPTPFYIISGLHRVKSS